MGDLTEPITEHDTELGEALPFVWDEPPTTLDVVSDLLGIAVDAQLDEMSDDGEATCAAYGIDGELAARLYSTLAGSVRTAVQHAITRWKEDAEQIEAQAGRARRIANEWHGGQGSAMCAFATSGAVLEGALAEEIRYELLHADVDVQGETAIDELTWLAEYVQMIPQRGPCSGWSEIWE